MAASNKRITVYLDAEQQARLEAIRARHGATSATGTLAWLVDTEARRVAGNATKEDALHRIEAQLASVADKLNIVLLLTWQQAGGEAVKATAKDVRRLRDLLASLTDGENG
jgi:hypothetical protein